MRLRMLTMRGIGPFGGTYRIDFDAIGKNGLFLLEGPTGAGKSTIIDAITWALYGSVTGGKDSTPDRIRSTHADPTEESFVDLWFTLDSGTFRVRRTPPWERDGRKTPIAATAKLWKLPEGAFEDGDFEAGEVLSTKVADVGQEIGERIGLLSEQFVQTMVLPQGKFADFLRLSSEERTGLLEKIFDTSVFRIFSDRLRDHASDSRKTIESCADATVTALSNTATVLGMSTEEIAAIEDAAREASLPEHTTDLFRNLETVVAAAQSEATHAREVLATTEERLTVSQIALEQEKTLERSLAQRNQLIEQHQLLIAQEEEIHSHKDALIRHSAAMLLRPFLDSATTAADDLARAEQGLKEATGMDPANVTAADLEKATSDSTTLARASGTIDEIIRQEAAFHALSEAQEVAGRSLQELHQSLATVRKKSEALPLTIANATAQLQKAHTLAATEDSARTAVDHAENLLKKLSALGDLRAEIARTQTAQEKALTLAVEAETASRHVADAWFASAAAILSERLKEGTPCPVCGSVHHPHPAPPENIAATREEVDAAAENAKEAREALAIHQEELGRLRGQESALSTECGEEKLESATEKVSAARQNLSAAIEAREEVKTLTTELESLHAQQEHTEQDISTLLRDVTTLEAEIAQRAKTLAEEGERLRLHLGDHTSAEELRIEHEQRISEHTTLVNALHSLMEARHTHTKSVSALTDALSASPFSSATAAGEALLEATEESRLRGAVEQHKNALRDVSRDFLLPHIASLTGEEKPNVPHKETLYREASTAAKDAAEYAAQAGDRASHSVKTFAVAQEKLQAWEAAYREAGPMVRLAELANAGNASVTRIPLATYALQQRFDRVVARANEHLERISLGRYSLHRIDEKEKGSRKTKSGLGLVVVDHLGALDGDIERSTRSLSGGETFYASLSLALGLADVVRAENGGIHMDTLMIDEGFGSLDDATLDQVLQVLTGLATAGRTVAIVSHVDELKKMIPERIVVTPHPDGSSSLSITA